MYFLMGIVWALLYELVLAVDPAAISLPTDHVQFGDISYFSFTTLTTLGYGDILPVTSAARILTILESTFGPLYLAIFVARLVGLHTTSRSE